jgi:hypothetical protein
MCETPAHEDEWTREKIQSGMPPAVVAAPARLASLPVSRPALDAARGR